MQQERRAVWVKRQACARQEAEHEYSWITDPANVAAYKRRQGCPDPERWDVLAGHPSQLDLLSYQAISDTHLLWYQFTSGAFILTLDFFANSAISCCSDDFLLLLYRREIGYLIVSPWTPADPW